MGKHSLVDPFMYHDLSDLESLILIQIFSKEQSLAKMMVRKATGKLT